MSNRKCFQRWFLRLLVFGLCSGYAEADVFDDVEVHGFATQGFVKTSANSFFGDSENGSFEFTELGVNATVEPSSSVRLSGQLLSRRAGEMSSGSPKVDFAIADFTIRSTERGSGGLLIGRIKNPLGLFNETRDVAFTRPGFSVPQVIYFDKIRDVILSSDGAGVRIQQFREKANINVYLATGQPQTNENIEYAYLGNGFDGDFDPDGLSFIARLLMETPDNRLRGSMSVASASLDFNRKGTDRIGDGNVEFLYWIGSLQFSTEDWTFTAEYMREPIDWRGFEGSIFDGMSVDAEGYFLQAAWRVAQDVELMFRYEEGFADRADRSGKDMEEATGGLVPSHSRYSKIYTGGVRWDFSPSIMFRVEYQRHNGTFVLSNRENPNPDDLDPDWDLFSLSISYRF